MSDYPPPPNPQQPEQPLGGSTPPPPPPPPPAPQQPSYGQQPTYGQPGQQPVGGYGAMPPAGIPRPGELLDRFLARLIDGILIGIVQVILFVIAGAIFISSVTYNANTGDFEGGGTFVAYAIFGILSAAISLGYFAFMESSRGQTVGKMLMKLRTFGPDGHSNPTMEQAVKRNIFQGLSVLYIIPVLGQVLAALGSLAAYIYAAVTINNDTVKREGWHDKFAGGTQVMKIG